MVVGSQILPKKTSYYLKYTWKTLSKGPIQHFLHLAHCSLHSPFRATNIGFQKLVALWATNLFFCAPTPPSPKSWWPLGFYVRWWQQAPTIATTADLGEMNDHLSQPCTDQSTDPLQYWNSQQSNLPLLTKECSSDATVSELTMYI